MAPTSVTGVSAAITIRPAARAAGAWWSAAEVRIEATGPRRGCGARAAVDGLSLRVAGEEIHGLVGPAGAGKTTTLRMLAGLLDPAGGSVRLVGRDPFESDGSVREAVGYLPQQYSLPGGLTVAESLAAFRELLCVSRAEFRVRRERRLAQAAPANRTTAAEPAPGRAGRGAALWPRASRALA